MSDLLTIFNDDISSYFIFLTPASILISGIVNELGNRLFIITVFYFLGPKSLISENFSPAFSDVRKGSLAERDILFILRIQKERFKHGDGLDEVNFIENFQVIDNFLKNSGFAGFLMHPGPMNIDSEITRDVANSKNSLVLRQVENGLYLRAALLSLIL